MNKKISIIGGDLRQIEVAKQFNKFGYEVVLFGFDKKYEDESIKIVNTLDEIKKSDIIILPIPITTDNISINAPFFDKKIPINYIENFNDKNKFIIGGKFNQKIKELVPKAHLADYSEREEFMIKNAISTAEGAIDIAISETAKTIFSSNCLVIGYGRIGTILSKYLKALGAKVTASARKYKDLALIESNDITSIQTKDILFNIEKYDIIFNTVPSMVLDCEKIDNIKKDCLIIDLASKPGGVDFAYCSKVGKNAIWALGLPGKVAPTTSGIIIKDTITNILSEFEEVLNDE